MGVPQLTGCVSPTIGTRKVSTYTAVGFCGYLVASVVATALAGSWSLSLPQRAIALIAPPIAFVAVVTIATAVKGREWIVFYQATFGAVLAVLLGSLVIGAPVWRELDVAVLGIGVFLVFGRVGCFHVACCHGRPSRRGVVYGDKHVLAGFWHRWQGRPLFPIQLVEAALALALVCAGLRVSHAAGAATITFGTGYAVMRFALELARGDLVRPYAWGISEAQWWCLATLVVCAIAWPRWWTVIALALVASWALALIARRRERAPFLPPHVRELDGVCERVRSDPTHSRRETSLGIGISCHLLPDGRMDWIFSAAHATWSSAAARRLATALWPEFELVDGRTRGVVHIVVPQ